jgi:[acyl-carrier-protein] S-malonyltransferase
MIIVNSVHPKIILVDGQLNSCTEFRRINMKKIAFLFPGQGAQTVGMGQDFYQEFSFVRELFDMAEETTRLKLKELCFKGPMADLTLTINLQPAVTVVNLAILAALEKEGVMPTISAGHSLGEFSALNAAGIISKEDTMKLVFKRGEYMHRESQKHQGAMFAVVGLSIDEVGRLVENASSEGIVSVANHNTANQIVITGAPAAVKKAAGQAKEKGARAIPLKVSGAWHSQLIQGAEKDFKEILDMIHFNIPKSVVIHNVTASNCEDPSKIKSLMSQQLCAPVKWYDTVQKIVEDDVTIFAEVGPGKVLTGLVKKIVPETFPAEYYNISNLKAFEQFLQGVS